MKIALLTDGIQPYVMGGMQRHSYFIAKYLAKNKIEVDLYHHWENKEHDIRQLAVFTEEEKKYIHSFVIDFPRKGIFPGHYLRRSFRYSEHIYAILKDRLDVDFIYAKGFAGWKLIDEKRKGGAFPPIGVKFHGLNMFQKPPSFTGRLEQLLFRPPAKFNMQHADYVFSYGGKITTITKEIGVDESKILEIPTGIESSWISENIKPSEGKRKFLFVGRYERLKGVEEITKSIQKIDASHDFEFHFVGPIPDKLKLKSSKVKYWGQLSGTEEVKQVMDGCDILLCPSYSEGMPNVIIEAMARGLAIIATDVGAVNYLVSNKNGWLLEGCSVDAIERAMKDAMSKDCEEIDRLKTHSLSFANQNLRWEKIAEDMIALLEKITT